MKWIAIPFIIIFFSCKRIAQSDKPVVIKDTAIAEDSIVVAKDSTTTPTYADSLPSGAYQGIFPCPDCDGIQQTVLFNADKTYEQEQRIWGKNESPQKSVGNWKRINQRIELSKNKMPLIDFIKKSDTLFAININGIELINSSKYFLIKRTLASENSLWAGKQKKGIDFAGVGNDPYWSLDIDKEKFILFKLENWKKPVIVPIVKPSVNKDTTFYNLEKNNIKWTITIFPQFCNDGISDYLYQYKVNVNYGGTVYKGCGVMLSKLSLR